MKKNRLTTVLLFVVGIVGLSLLLYPTVSNYWNAKHATQAINRYNAQVSEIDENDYQQMWKDAIMYNRDLIGSENTTELSAEMKKRYDKCLNLFSDGIIGYVEIAKLDVSLPVYHGTADSTLQVAVGHLEWSSLPTGGKGTHCVLSGHRGLPNAKLFTDLDKLREGDKFTLHVLNEKLTYEVDQIRTVLPNDTADLMIQNGKDYCTLFTCTPYGINTHRLLVRGHRVAGNSADNARVISEAVIIDPLIIAPLVAFPVLLILLLVVVLKKPPKNVSKPIRNTESEISNNLSE